MLSLFSMSHADRTRARLMRSIDYIEQHLADEIPLGSIASKAALSDFHFHRLFRTYFGVTVMNYVRRRKITRAAEALLTTDNPVLAIALDAGFQSQAAFTRAFRRVYHAAPGEYRARRRAVPWLATAPINDAALAMLPGLGKEQPRLEQIGGFGVTGIAIEIDAAGRDAIPDLWERLAAAIGYDRFARSDRIGISAGNEAVLGGILNYMAGVSEPDGDMRRDGLERRAIAGGDYLVFRFAGPQPEVTKAYDYIFGSWFSGSRICRTGSLASLESGQAIRAIRPQLWKSGFRCARDDAAVENPCSHSARCDCQPCCAIHDRCP